MSKWAHLENVATLAAIVILVWLTKSVWWALLACNLNSPGNRAVAGGTGNTTQENHEPR